MSKFGGAALVLQGPTPKPAARTPAQQLWCYAVTRQYERFLLNWISLSDYKICGVRRLVRTFRHMLEDRIENQLPRVRQPCLVVRGTRNRIVSRDWAEEAARLLPDRRLAVIPGAAHAINFSYPKEFKRAIMLFLLACSARSLSASPSAPLGRERVLAGSS
jgi:2-hydroxy-6-oxonona-2,4-dienedioate hydrolase